MFRPSWRDKPVPRVLQRCEREMLKRRDGIWGAEQKLRFTIAGHPGEPDVWFEELSKWANIHRDSNRVWRLVELVLFDWILDPLVTTKLHNDIRQFLKLIISTQNTQTSQIEI